MNDLDLSVLFWLLPSDVQRENISTDINDLERIFDNVCIYTDCDECIDDLSSISHHNVFFVLGRGRSNLVDIICSFGGLRFIYLSEQHYYPMTGQVRGVFPDQQKLLVQLKRDVKIVEERYNHLRVSKIGDSLQHQVTTTTIQESRSGNLRWTKVFFDLLRELPRENETVNEDLIKECRHIYRDNSQQLQMIDEFQKTYRPSEAIRMVHSRYICLSIIEYGIENRKSSDYNEISLYYSRYL